MMIIDAFKQLWGTILGNDFYILVFAFITFVVYLWVRIHTRDIKRDSNKIIEEHNALYAKRLYNKTNKGYTVFVMFISVFPLLGMFGTVCGLLGLDLSAGDMENIKNNFFVALTSTAWGIIFSVIFKIVHACTADTIEDRIDTIKKIYVDMHKEI